jgi:ornithine decarboxylase
MHKSYYFDNAALGDIVRRGDTPFLLLNRGRFAELFKHFTQFGKVYYPAKSNDHVDVLREVARLGGCFDVDGISHIRQLLSLGVSPDRIQFGIPVKKQQDVEDALNLNIGRFVVDSISEYKKISRFGKKVGFLVRIAISDILDFSDVSLRKWGMPLVNVADMRELIKQDGNEFLGISFYIPQELYTQTNFSKTLARITKVFEGDAFQVLDIGGGLDNSFSDDFRKDLASVKKTLNISDIVLEPGRNLLDPCIDMVVSVVGVCKREDQRWAYIDAGIYSGLLDAVIKKRTFEILTFSDTEQSAEYRYFVAGPTSDSLDFLGEYSFGTELNADDRLIIKNCGAYTYALRTKFGGIDGLGLHVVEKRGPYEL